MKDQAAKVVIYLVLGSLAALAAMSLYKVVKPERTEYERIARANNWDVDRYVFLRNVTDKISFKRELTADEWAALKSILVSAPELDLRVRAMPLLGKMSETPYRMEAIQLAKDGLSDRDEHVVALALLNLQQLNAPGWQDRAKKLLTHSSSTVRKRAAALLKQGPTKERQHLRQSSHRVLALKTDSFYTTFVNLER